MSLREWYAGMALQGILAAQAGPEELPLPEDGVVAIWAFEYADAMLAQNQKQIDTRRIKK